MRHHGSQTDTVPVQFSRYPDPNHLLYLFP